jgi:hypothetical protein
MTTDEKKERRLWHRVGNLIATGEQKRICFAIGDIMAGIPYRDGPASDRSHLSRMADRVSDVFPCCDRTTLSPYGATEWWPLDAKGRKERLIAIALLHAIVGEDLVGEA